MDEQKDDYVNALAEQMEQVERLIGYDPDKPHPAPDIEHRDDMPADAALWECYDLWASGAWDDRNAEHDLTEVRLHLDRFFAEREAERQRHLSSLPPVMESDGSDT